MVDIKSFNSLLDLLDALPDECSCIEYLENLRWKDGVVSPFDCTSKVYKLGNYKYMCKNTQNKFNVKTSTIFENTKLPLRKWFTAIWLILSNKKGISSLQLSKNINVTQKTAWLLLQKIRFCMDCKNTNRLSIEVEADETYIGGKSKNRHANKKVKGSQGRSSKCKTPVLGMVQRKGDVVAMVVKNTSMAELTPLIKEYVHRSAILHTDQWIGYHIVSKLYNHSKVDHSKGQYVDGDCYTNTIEGFWSLLKRGYIGIYHYMSKKHLQKYVDEFVFRYNTRMISDSDKFNFLLSVTRGYSMTYNDLVAA